MGVGLATSIVWVVTIIAMGISYAVIMNEKQKDKDNTSDSMEETEKETTEIK